MIKKVLVCSSPDLNYIDGSSIWAQTIALAFANHENVEVDFIAKSTPERFELYQPLLDKNNINIIDGSDKKYWKGKSFNRLSPVQMAQLTTNLYNEFRYDGIIVRGLEIAQSLLDQPLVLKKCWLYLTDIPQNIMEYDAELISVMRELANHACFILCQSIGFVELWKSLVPGISDKKFKIYSPVIPDIDTNLTDIGSRESQVVYAGKFKSDWKTLEMANVWSAISSKIMDSQFIMIGDKIHQEKDYPDYHNLMLKALKNTERLQWAGAKSREEVQELLKRSRVGLSWRSESMNETLEYSTKILEYGGSGCAAILNRNNLHENLLGKDYPLFANSEEEFGEKLLLALSDLNVLRNAANKLYLLAKKHTFSERSKELKIWLNEAIVLEAKNNRPVTILVAGHDLKFFNLLQQRLFETGRYNFIIDQWQGHNKHDESQSLKLLSQADIIFCEWCLGNLEWYSKHKQDHQKLIARFHAQESKLPYLANANLDAIDHISFVSKHIRDETLSKISHIPINKTSIIANYLDDKKFTPLKKMGDAQFVLGMIGVTPKGKRLDRAIDLLEALLEKDNRYCLRIKGKNPLSYAWIHNRPEEIEYYKKILNRINSNSNLRYKVIFDPAGDDVNQWLSLVGYILSPSDAESFHMAIGEGILAGCCPIIWDWYGAKEIWGENYVFSNLSQIRDQILLKSNSEYELPSELISKFVIKRWESILEEVI